MRGKGIGLVLVLCLVSSSGTAQLAPAPDAELIVSYRDGDRWFAVERLGTDGYGSRVRISLDGHPSFEAWVGPGALVRRRDGTRSSDAELAARGLSRRRDLAPSIGLSIVTAEGEDGLTIAARLANDPELEVTPDLLLRRTANEITVPPNDPRYSGQRYLSRIDIEDAWAISTGDPASTIAVVDTGCDGTHPDLLLLPGYDAFDDDDDPTPPASTEGNAHGTECAGIVAAIGDNGEGIAGTCPECTLRCVRLLPGGDAPIPISTDVAAFQHGIDWNVVAISNSWGFREAVAVPSPLRAIMIAAQTMGRGGLGAVVVFAAGNENREIIEGELYGVPGVITVGGINIFDEAAPYSNHGAAVDLVAPLGALTTDITGPDGSSPDDYTSTFSGTSSACPVVSGVIGLLASAYPEATAAELHDAVIATTRSARFATPDENGHDPLYGYGIVDPAGALAYLAPPVPDAGVEQDAGTETDAGVIAPPSGCGCAAQRRSPSIFAAAFLLLALARAWRARATRC